MRFYSVIDQTFWKTEGVTPTGTIANRLALAGAALTPTERRVAEVVTTDPTALAFDTVAELAERVGSSGPTIVRFAAKLGFDGYSELQQHARAALTEQLSPVDRSRSSARRGGGELRRRTLDAVLQAADRIDDELVDVIGHTIARARGYVWVVASETSSPVAQLLVANLRLLRPRVQHVSGSNAAVAATVVDASDRDVVIAIDAERYEQAVHRITSRLAGRGARVIAITDGATSPLAAIADIRCDVKVPAIGPFDSAIPFVIVAELVTAAVARASSAGATRRLEAAEATWSELDVFTAPTPSRKRSR
jgi:DNA-binding MurR/RpiR family transcriptional regulator